MGIINRKLRFASPENNPTSTDSNPAGEDPTVAFTLEEYGTLLEALELDDDAQPADVVAAVTELAETANQKPVESESDKIAASIARKSESVRIDQAAWKDMQNAIARGVKVETQRQRLEAEQVVDEAIKLNKASAVHREFWIQSYNDDRGGTIQRLSRGDAPNMFELGHSRDPFTDSHADPKSNWVR